MTDVQHPSGECPSCRRFVGPYAKCPYCGADVGQRMSVRIFKFGSLLLAVVGVLVLLLIANRSQVKRVDIGATKATMNWAYVGIEGVVSRQPALDPEDGTLSFWLDDGTGEIMVIAYRTESDALVAGKVVPTMGDRVALEGTLRVREDFQYLVLNVPQHVEVLSSSPVPVPIAEVGDELLYDKVAVRGVIRGDRIPYEGLRILTVRDETGEIDVALWSRAVGTAESWPALTLGQSISVSGAVDEYQGSPQVSVGRPEDLVVLDEAVDLAPLRKIAGLSTADAGLLALVQGVIFEVDAFSSGVKYTLDDGSGTLVLLLWQDLLDEMENRGDLVEGVSVRALGKIADYRGELEIVPELVSDVELLEEADPEALEKALSDVDRSLLGRRVRVQGVLKSLRTFSAGVKGTLDDGTGEVTLLVWQDVLDSLPDTPLLAPGVLLEVQGEVNEYRGELEIAPLAAVDMSVVGQIDLPSMDRAIGQISTDDVGQVMRVTGLVTGTRTFSHGLRSTLDDGTGKIVLLVWQDLHDRLEADARPAAGRRLSVRGEIAEYQGKLQIVPQVPADVQTVDAERQVTATPTPTVQAGAVAEPTGTPSPASPTPTLERATSPTPSKKTRTPTPKPTIEIRTIGAISREDVGRTFAIERAGIEDTSYFSKGIKHGLTDGTGSIILLLWQNVVEELSCRHDLFPGSQVRVQGPIDWYEGDLEIIPRKGVGVAVVSRGNRPTIEERSLSDITPSDEGRIFRVEGTVTRTESHTWLKVWIQDGTGEMLIYLPARLAPYLPRGIDHGARLQVTGEVEIYEGVLEIIPVAAADVTVH